MQWTFWRGAKSIVSQEDVVRRVLNVGVLIAGVIDADSTEMGAIAAVVANIADALLKCPKRWPYNSQGPLLRLLGFPETPNAVLAIEAGLAAGEKAGVAAETQLVLPMAPEQMAAAIDGTGGGHFGDFVRGASAVMVLDGEAEQEWPRDMAGQIIVDNAQVLILAGNAQSSARQEWADRLRIMADEAGLAVLSVGAGGAIEIECPGVPAADWPLRLSQYVKRCLHCGKAPAKVRQAKVAKRAVKAVGRDWDSDWRLSGKQGPSLGRINDLPLMEHYAWSDDIACQDGTQYRRFGRIRQGLVLAASFCVALAFYAADILKSFNVADAGLTGKYSPLVSMGFCLQLIFLFLAFTPGLINRLARWHANLLDCRMFAELLRISRMLRFTGRCLTARRLERLEIDAYPNWLLSLFSAIQREAGLPSLVMTKETRTAFALFVRGVVDGQIRYQEKVTRTNHVKHKRISRLGFLFFVLSLLAMSLRFWEAYRQHDSLFLASKVCAMIFQGFAAYFLGIAGFASHDTLAQRASLMSLHLLRARDRLAEPEALDTPQTCQIVWNTAELMASEVLDWRGILKSKSISLFV